MIDLSKLNNKSLRNYITNQLRKGATEPIEKVPPLFKIGCGFDSESTTITDRVKVGKKRNGEPVYKTRVVNCFNYCYQISLTPNDFAIYRTIENILNFFTQLIKAVGDYNERRKDKATFIIWCANLSHEWSFIKGYINDRFNITKVFAKSPRDVLYIQLENYIEFRECIGLFGHSLADIAKNWCSADNQKRKGDLDYSLIRHAETHLDSTERGYIISDVTILSEMHQNVIRHYTQPNGVCRLPYTSSGFLRMALKESIRNDADLTELTEIYNESHKHKFDNNIGYLKKINENCVLNPFQWHVCREYSYAGGLCGTNVNLAGKILNNVVCADITSDYPAQLTQKLFPCGKLQKASGDLEQKFIELLKDKKPFFATLKISRIHAKTQHATFSKHKIINDHGFYTDHGKPRKVVTLNGKIKHAENIIVCWNDIDIKAYKELYEIDYIVLNIYYFGSYKRLPHWFLNVLWTAYIDKANLKKRGLSETIEYNDSKRNVNTAYGVLATRVNDSFDDLDECLNFKIAKEKTWKEVKRGFWLNPYWAFWCTSYARALLMYFIARYPNAIIQYDTDSLYYLKDKGIELEKALTKYNEQIKLKNSRIFRNNPNAEIFDDLGTWDFDDVYTKFIGMGAKKYIKRTKDGEIKTVIAGLPKNAIPKEIETRGINEPFNYYNPLVKFITEGERSIVIKHIFAGKFASVYCDELSEKYDAITDYNNKTIIQKSSTYHAIIPIDFTLSMAKDFISHIIERG